MSDPRRPIPSDFAEMAKSLSREAMVRHYRVSKKTLARWIGESGITPVRGDFGASRRLAVPDGFAAAAVRSTDYALAAVFGCDRKTAARWRMVVGVPRPAASLKTGPGARRRHNLPSSYYLQAKAITTGADGLVARAAQHLQRDAQVFRCTPEGKPKPTGSHYRYGRIVLTDDEVVARAERKGFKRDWAAL